MHEQVTMSEKDPMASYAIVHRVQCNESDHPNHEGHEAKMDFLDVPRLYADANQTSSLKGTKPSKGTESLKDTSPLDNNEWYLEDNRDTHFVILNIYDCGQYHREITDQFVPLSLPFDVDGRVLDQIKPYLYVLKKDAREAIRRSQILIPSPELSRALNSIEAFHPLEMSDWSAGKSLAYPYPQLRHYKDLLEKTAKELIPEVRSYVTTLRSYLETDVSDEWNEADHMFEKGLVSKQHWTKLFRRNEPSVALLDGEPRAFICRDSYHVSDDKLHLKCWSWEFDGHFFRQDFSVNIDWPDDSEVRRITDLSHYPLRFDTSDLADRLHNRGVKFWSCRQRKHINYSSSSQDPSGQAVCSNRTCLEVPLLTITGSTTLHGGREHLQAAASTGAGGGIISFHATGREHNARRKTT